MPKKHRLRIFSYLNVGLACTSLVVMWKYVRVWWLSLLLSPLVGLGTYLLACYIVGDKFAWPRRSVLFQYSDIKKRFLRESFQNIYNCFSEEMLYRLLIQNVLFLLTESAVLSILIGSAYFAGVHVIRKRAIVQMIDLTILAILLSVIYHFTKDIAALFIIHLVRNQFVIFDKYMCESKKRTRARKILKIMRSNPT